MATQIYINQNLNQCLVRMLTIVNIHDRMKHRIPLHTFHIQYRNPHHFLSMNHCSLNRLIHDRMKHHIPLHTLHTLYLYLHTYIYFRYRKHQSTLHLFRLFYPLPFYFSNIIFLNKWTKNTPNYKL